MCAVERAVAAWKGTDTRLRPNGSVEVDRLRRKIRERSAGRTGVWPPMDRGSSKRVHRQRRNQQVLLHKQLCPRLT